MTSVVLVPTLLVPVRSIETLPLIRALPELGIAKLNQAFMTAGTMPGDMVALDICTTVIAGPMMQDRGIYSRYFTLANLAPIRGTC